MINCIICVCTESLSESQHGEVGSDLHLQLCRILLCVGWLCNANAAASAHVLLVECVLGFLFDFGDTSVNEKDPKVPNSIFSSEGISKSLN